MTNVSFIHASRRYNALIISAVLYTRLNTPTGKEEIDLADYTKMERLSQLTKTYLGTTDAQNKIDAVVRILVPPAKSAV